MGHERGVSVLASPENADGGTDLPKTRGHTVVWAGHLTWQAGHALEMRTAGCSQLAAQSCRGEERCCAIVPALGQWVKVFGKDVLSFCFECLSQVLSARSRSSIPYQLL